MTIRSWVNPWTTPGQSESTRGSLDRRIGRDLVIGRDGHVKRNLIVDNDLTLSGKFNWVGLGAWQAYTPAVRGYRVAAGGGLLATGILTASVTGMWRNLDNIVFFQATVQVIAPRSPNWASNMYVDLPTKSNFQFTSDVIYHATGDTGDSTWYPLLGVTRAGKSEVIIIPGSNTPTTIVTLSSFSPPYEFTVSGVYEFQA